ncbi:MAG: cysteine dioxygenase family protein [Candidatus Sericytochromatia bacterium]|nr:cysteine dioxygenase family protein [Candidatus Sericytochromatia bacterium]
MYNFSNFVAELEEIVSKSSSDKEIIHHSSNSMKKLLSNHELIQDEHLSGEPTIYKSADNGFIIQLFTWSPGCETPVHDHETWGIMGLYENSLKIAEYCFLPIDNNQTELREIQTYVAEKGDVCYIIQPDEDIHHISNPSDQRSISIHVYGKQIDEYNIYDLENNQVIHKVV